MRQSSLEAYNDVKPRIPTHFEEITKALEKIKRGTSKRIAMNTSLSYHQTARRLKEMEAKGTVKIVGRDENQRYNPIIWELNETKN